MDPILSCHWRDPDGDWALTVSRNGTTWELLAAAPRWSETLPFADPDDVRRLAQTLLDLPAEPEPYEFEWQLSRTENERTENERTHFATFAVGLDPTDGHRPYLAYQSYYHRGQATGLGLEVICEDPPIDQLRAQAHAFLTSLPSPQQSSRRKNPPQQNRPQQSHP
ncbi:hypothetical protein F7Q99_03420 [Streptomyces kaniharaensis]|uniref:Uncharacterized protein n=1 Tax=Streptomyces kaniharaensis TaxID=212423 RepID=A0A6N7KMJ0_9ACTN|nr:hypothetical protein [Streptomyces kaniharaensis]MQS11364.1 hypothetical protein [Streptomyces kaniharaensis]